MVKVVLCTLKIIIGNGETILTSLINCFQTQHYSKIIPQDACITGIIAFPDDSRCFFQFLCHLVQSYHARRSKHVVAGKAWGRILYHVTDGHRYTMKYFPITRESATRMIRWLTTTKA